MPDGSLHGGLDFRSTASAQVRGVRVTCGCSKDRVVVRVVVDAVQVGETSGGRCVVRSEEDVAGDGPCDGRRGAASSNPDRCSTKETGYADTVQ